MIDKLQPIIRQVEEIYLANVAGLEKLRTQPGKQLDRKWLSVWLDLIYHKIPEDRFKDRQILATAYYLELRIDYNPLVINDLVDRCPALLQELVAHEIGHLFTFSFIGVKGHGLAWQEVGNLVGYGRTVLPQEEYPTP